MLFLRERAAALHGAFVEKPSLSGDSTVASAPQSRSRTAAGQVTQDNNTRKQAETTRNTNGIINLTRMPPDKLERTRTSSMSGWDSGSLGRSLEEGTVLVSFFWRRSLWEGCVVIISAFPQRSLALEPALGSSVPRTPWGLSASRPRTAVGKAPPLSSAKGGQP